MLVILDDMFVSSFMRHHLMPLISLILFVVIYGRLLLLASLDLNKYYLVILDDCTHYLWTFPLRFKSDTFSAISNFLAYASTQFGASIKAVQCDNGKEFDNSTTRTFFLTRGIHLRMSCPYTSPQNGKAERIIRSINDVVRSQLFQAVMPSVTRILLGGGVSVSDTYPYPIRIGYGYASDTFLAIS